MKINMNFFDLLVYEYFLTNRVPFLTDFFHFFTRAFDADIYFVLLIGISILLILYHKNIRTAFLFGATILITGILVLILKYIFGINRPDGGVVAVLSNSFPSYHATIATVFFLSLYYIFKEQLKGIRRFPALFFCVTFIFIVAFSRVYLGVHWLSDIVAGIVLGVTIVYVSKKWL
ncbi:MAG: phosphatase PAP2 family protein [Patescibacteria group bacterium]